MDCSQFVIDDSKVFLSGFNRKMARLRVPVSGSIELTRFCNLTCVHCFIRAESAGEEDRPVPDLGTAQWLEIIDQVAEAGCLYLLITGGEPLLRSDFPAIYSHAKKRGLLVTLFTNGTMVTEETAALFRELPPQAVEVTVYGATKQTYEGITGVAGSYARCLEGIHRLLDGKVKVRLKTMLMKSNRHEFDDIRRMAERLGVKFRFDAALFPKFSGDRTPLSYRVPHREVIEKELADRENVEKWRQQYERLRDLPSTDTLYHCGAGLTGFHIDCQANLLPCLIATDPVYNLLSDGGFLKGWREVMPRLRDRKADPAVYTCNSCEIRAICSFCPAFFKLERGDENSPSHYLCSMAHERHEYLRCRSK